MKQLLSISILFLILLSCNTVEKPSEHKDILTQDTSTLLPNKIAPTNDSFLVSEVAPKIDTIPKKTVLDYFMLLPEKEYFQCDCGDDEPVIKDRTTYIKRKNVKNGYILARDGCGELDFSVVLFRDKINHRDIIAVDNIWISGDYFCLTDGTKGLLELTKSGQWKNVTKEYINLDEVSKKLNHGLNWLSFQYPEKGTTVKIFQRDNMNEVLGFLVFKNDHFVFKKNE